MIRFVFDFVVVLSCYLVIVTCFVINGNYLLAARVYCSCYVSLVIVANLVHVITVGTRSCRSFVFIEISVCKLLESYVASDVTVT